jgi:beta-mannosidase
VQPDGYGRAYETVRHWLGHDPLTLDWEAYAKASALLHAEGLTEYITNYRRRMFSSAAAVFWMYNDSWPVTHGWTTVDYYLRRKLAFYVVKRAFAPVTVVVAHEGDLVRIYGVNDSPIDWIGQVRYGLVALAGGYPLDRHADAVLPANSSTPLGEFPTAAWDAAGLTTTGAFAVLSREGEQVAQHRLFRARFGELQFAPPAITLERTAGAVTLTSPTFAWGVCLDVEGDRPLLDNCIDLLPGVPYRMPWPDALGDPAVVYVGSRDAVGPTR